MSDARSEVQGTPVERRYDHVIQRACTDKTTFRRRAAAKAAARDFSADGDIIRHYRCPFEPDHYHIGHPPGQQSMRELAAAVRWYRQERGHD